MPTDPMPNLGRGSRPTAPSVAAGPAAGESEPLLPDAKIDAGKAQDHAPAEPPATPGRVPASTTGLPDPPPPPGSTIVSPPAPPPAVPPIVPPVVPPVPPRTPPAPPPATPGLWSCHVPQDATVPRRFVRATSAGDAERAYRETLGVVTFGHPVSAAEVTDAV